MASPAFEELNERMLTRLLKINPDMATIIGKHDPYDHQLPHGGVKRLEDNLSLFKEWTDEAEQIAGTERLSKDQEISLEVLRMTLALQRFSLEDYPLWRMYPDAFEQPGWAIFTMMARDYAPLEERMAGISSRIAQMPRYLSQFRERFNGSRAIRAWSEAALEACDSFPGFLTSVRQMFVGEASASVQKDLEQNCDRCMDSVRIHRDWLKDIVDDAVDDFALGEEKLGKLLRIRGFDLTPNEMLGIGEHYLSKMRDERKAIAKRLTPDGNLETANRMIRENCAMTFEGVLRETIDKAGEARKFISDHNLTTMDERAELNIIETPEFLRPSLPTAALMTPAKFDDIQSGAYLITRPKNEGDISSLWNRAMIINTTVHEAYPGHFLQGVMSNRMPWMHQLPHMMTMTDTMTPPYETCEGWAHYCEEMMYEEGFEATDQAAIAMLDAGIWRACRTIYDIKLHTKKATLREMANLLASESSTTMEAAMEDVVGFSRTPAYPLSYLVGKHLVIELRDQLEAKLGARFDKKKFHDLLAMNGNLPFHIVEEIIWEEMEGRDRT